MMTSRMFRAGPADALRARAAALFSGDRGAIGVFFAMCSSVMAGAMCMSLGMIQYELMQAHMQMALDVATLSAAANIRHYAQPNMQNVAQWQRDARAYYDANMPTGYEGLVMPDTGFTANISGDASAGFTVKLSASGTLPLLASNIFGALISGTNAAGAGPQDTMTISANNAAIYSPKTTLELVMVLDNTGSMADPASTDSSQGSKIQGLRAASQHLVTSIFNQPNGDSYIGLVPFTTVVNLTGALSGSSNWMTPRFAYNPTNMSMAPNPGITQSGWQGCAVEPRDASGNLYPKAYAPKDSPGFTPFYYNVPPTGFKITTYNQSDCTSVVSTKTVLGVPLTRQTNGTSTQCGSGSATGIWSQWFQPNTTSGTTTIYQNGNTNASGASNGPCGIQPAIFLTKDQTALTNSINAMKANGSTIIPTGLLWGWRMLSSDWSNDVSKGNGWISTDSSLPRPETNEGLLRVAILLTDGENDPGSTDGLMPLTAFNGLSGVANGTLRAPTVTRSNGTALTDGKMSSVTDINAFQLGVCSAMKAQGIIIYGITFGTGATSSAAVKTMQSCASPGNYYHAPSNADLDTIFQEIATGLGILRLTQ
ncbi:VWA domain-containing protein [Caballeronia sp. Sq4a]|uniref:VWA domain-containing protein n=1 Tax=Caballeronia sp. Sq4a TaxID=2878152 RepID=UPI0020BEACF7|nr:VWA domain-containing protein [Caballeronia sp. Sq4a]